MQLKLALVATFAAFVVANTGFTIPEGTEDGVYIVTYENGVESHTKISDAKSIEKRDPLRRKFRKLRNKAHNKANQAIVVCGGTQELNEDGIKDSNNLLDEMCGNEYGKALPEGKPFYAKRNGVVAFACNNGGGNNRCDSQTRFQSTLQIMRQCGEDRAGTATFRSQLSYGYDVETATFCGITAQ